MRLRTFTVSEITNRIGQLLSQDIVLSRLSIEGEISSIALYKDRQNAFFTIKDEKCQISCVYFGRSDISTIFDGIDIGTKVQITGRINVYGASGKYQLIADSIEILGEGRIDAELKKLISNLAKLGYFDQARKKLISPVINSLAVLTSITGAAIGDIKSSLANKDAVLDIDIYSVRVQGANAPASIADALSKVNSQQNNYDLILLTRGGGSNEDLSAFNDIRAVEAVYNSSIPVLTAIGHERDLSICDMVSDWAIHTPTAAADFISQRSSRSFRKQKLDEIMKNIFSQVSSKIENREIELTNFRLSQSASRLVSAIETKHRRLDKQLFDLRHCIQKLETINQELRLIGAELNTLNPLKVLERGYSLIYKDERIIKSTKALNTGDKIRLVTSRGSADAIIENID